MLRFAPKGNASAHDFVTSEEDRLLRLAFGRFGGSLVARCDAMPVVARYQQRAAGMWLLCDCQPGATRPPALIPVSLTHLRRHDDTRWAAHAETCDFHREPGEQRVLVASYQRARARPYRLARRLDGSSQELRREFRASAQSSGRPGLAHLLTRLVTDAGLQGISPGGQLPHLGDQVKAIWAASRAIEIDADVRLSDFICTSPSKLDALQQKVVLGHARFRHTRPHGILILRAAAVGEGRIQPLAGPAIPVSGRLAVFAESADGPGGRQAGLARAPYLAACVIGPATLSGRVEVLSAYAHPCAAEQHLMLVDSDMERRTLAQLRSLQSWLSRKENIEVSIEKPLFDVGPEVGPETQPRPPCIPDFIVRARTAAAGTAAIAAVETMGFADAEYRGRKERVHVAISSALGDAPVVMHDFHEPAGRPQQWRDDLFWRALRRAIAPETGGSDHDARAGRSPVAGSPAALTAG